MNATNNATDTTAAASEAELMVLAAQCRAQLTAPGAPFELTTVEINGQALPAYRNAFASLPALLNSARVHSANEFMVYEGDRWTYARFFAAADARSRPLFPSSSPLWRGSRLTIVGQSAPEAPGFWILGTRPKITAKEE